MRRFRFHLGTLVILILLLGVGFAALRESNEIWDSSIFSITLGILLIAIILAVHRAERRRAFWLGFALFGWIYLGLCLVPSIESRLITTKALAYLDSKVPGRAVQVRIIGTTSVTLNNQLSNVALALSEIQAAPAGQGQPWTLNVTTQKLLGGWSGSTENFVRIGHSLFALIAAFLGGQLSRRLCRASRDVEAPMAVEAGGGTS
jgi:cbb3-type cytochrome oxidase subunit 3